MVANHEVIDPEAAILLSEAAKNLNADTADMLHQATSTLGPDFGDTVDMLYHATRPLGQNFSDTVDALHQATRALGPDFGDTVDMLNSATSRLAANLNEDLIEALDEKIKEIRRLLGNM